MMTVAEAINAKIKLEADMLLLIDRYERDSGARVAGISLRHPVVHTWGSTKHVIGKSVHVVAELNADNP